jgi:hypothetical protein
MESAERKIERMSLAPLSVKWVNLMLIHLRRQGVSEKVLTAADLCPGFGQEILCSEADLEPRQAFWSKVVNRLKIMANLDPVACKEVVRGKIFLIFGKKDCEIGVEFPPGLVPESVRVTCARSPA